MKSHLHISMVGLGYVGCVTAACLADCGHYVVATDIDENKVRQMNEGRSTVYEPGVEELIKKNVLAGRLSATISLSESLSEADICMITVGTPKAPNGGLNFDQIFSLAETLAGLMKGRTKPITFVLRSTVEPGTSAKFVARLKRDLSPRERNIVSVVYNPEFLREGSAIADFFEPDAIVIGTMDGHPDEQSSLMYEGIPATIFNVDFRTAELTKYANNSWHATKVAFANELGTIAKVAGANVDELFRIFLGDTKLNISARYLLPGEPYGGSCLPKDLSGLNFLSRGAGLDTPLLATVESSNNAHAARFLDLVKEQHQPQQSIGFLGICFKANTDDIRNSPFLSLAKQLIDMGYRVAIYDSFLNEAFEKKRNIGLIQSILGGASECLVDDLDMLAASADIVCVNGVPRDKNVLSALAGKKAINLGMSSPELGFMQVKEL